jgi:aminoglycoside phosphotransferase (APT) family kinase protein
VELQDRRAVVAAFDHMWERHRAEAACLSHGDAHIGNAYLDADRQPTFFDWQGVCIGPPLDDVSYFITGALSIADRREHERALLRHYLAALSTAGAPVPGFDDAWHAYRCYALHGFLWVVTPPLMQPWRNVSAMADRHIAAILELETLSALGAVH